MSNVTVRRFGWASSITATATLGGNMLEIPDRQQAIRLARACPNCMEVTQPVSVLYELDRNEMRMTGRICTYVCECSAKWLQQCPPASNSQHHERI